MTSPYRSCPPGNARSFVPCDVPLLCRLTPEYFLHSYIRPTGRSLGASQLEWSAYAEKR
jgi:hypothetical protein